MTTDDFLSKLEEPSGKVELQSSVLSPGARTLRYALLGGLKSVLPKGTVIDGIELQRIDADWQGETEWVMLLDSCVVHLRLDTIERPRRYRLRCRIHPLSTLLSVDTETEHQEEMQLVQVRQAKITLTFTKDLISATCESPDQNAALLSFANRVLAIRGR